MQLPVLPVHKCTNETKKLQLKLILKTKHKRINILLYSQVHKLKCENCCRLFPPKENDKQQTLPHESVLFMGCGASSEGNPSSGGKATTLHSKIRWFNPQDDPSAKQKRLQQIIALLPKFMNTPDAQNGNVALHIAAQNGHYEVVDLLLTRGASPNPKNRNGNTPLHMAMEYDFPKVAELLIQKGADVKIKNDEGNEAGTGIEGTKQALTVGGAAS